MSFSSVSLDTQHIRTLTSRIPEGFHVERIDTPLAERIRDEVSKDLIMSGVFTSPSDFVERGVGSCAIANDGGIVCGATSALICDDSIETQINTNGPFRRMGLATAASAALIEYCLEQGIERRWDTGNPKSEKLAEKLGYIATNSYEWLLLSDERKVPGGHLLLDSLGPST